MHFPRSLKLPLLVGLSLLAIGIGSPAADPPNYGECRLDSIFPAGGQVGQTVMLELRGNNGGLDGAKDLIFDGPAGITVEEIKNQNTATVNARIKIAADALPGRRYLRLVNERSGLTCFGWFVVGKLPEVIEVEPNTTSQAVALPVVVNGRVNPAADVDSFSFAAKAGQKLTAAVVSHAIDIHGQYKDWGLADVSLQMLDDKGKVLAEAEDTIGLDPQVHVTVPADGQYIARVQLLGYRGFPEAVYRLTLGDVPVVTGVYPPGGKRGETVNVEFSGPGLPAGTRGQVKIPTDENLPLQYIYPDGPAAGDHDVPFLRGDDSEVLEAEPNDAAAQATPVAWPATVNGRFGTSGDADWFKVPLKKGQTVLLETYAHRHLRSPVDTSIQVHDTAGKMLAENDDDPTPLDYMSIHDYKTTDSRLQFQAPADGDYFVRVVEQTGLSGERCVYRLSITEAVPDFRMLQFPDAVPIWGPGSTASLLVRVDRFQGLKGEIELKVEGLPPGWTGSTAINPEPVYAFYYGRRTLLTITAPADAKPGTVVPFHIVGTAMRDGKPLRRIAQSITLFYSSDTGFFRVSPQARAVVTRPIGPRFELTASELTVTQGEASKIAVKVMGTDESPLTILANVPTDGVQSNLGSPTAVPVVNGLVEVPIKSEGLPPGTHTLVISGRWGGDIRGGMPGPCSPVILLKVKPKP